ncbi:MAG: RNA polymerase sigma factor [Tepidisphaeraceae bacterium]
MIDSATVTGWFEAHAARLVLYARQWLSDASAQDVVQDVFARLISQSRRPDDARAWLYRSVRNAAISESRSWFRRRKREQAVASKRGEWFEAGVDDLIDASTAQATLESLPPEQREIVVLRIWSQLSWQQIAEVTGSRISTVFDRYKSALGAMKQKMEMTRCKTTPD